jgi:pyridoxal phosphate enzyme (YggS family)
MRTIIVAVTKRFPFEIVKKAYADGYRHFGENRVEEAKEKVLKAQETGMNDIIWHMIGHVQSRKVRDVVALFDRVDSVDSIELLQKLDREAGIIHKKLHVLLEVNISGEKTKFGFNVIPKDLNYSNLVVDGFMTMAPLVKNPEDNRKIFRSLKVLSVKTPFIGKELSMGTSCDYHVAIEEGATQVRLGNALFGPRE